MPCANRPFADFDRCSFCLLRQACPWRPGGPLDLEAMVQGVQDAANPMFDMLTGATVTGPDGETWDMMS